MEKESQPSLAPDSTATIEELAKELKEQKEKYLYLYADFDNFRKRMLQERTDWVRYGWAPVARELLEVIDNIERALASVALDSDPTLIEGLKITIRQFKAVLEKQGVQEFDSTGKQFDPNLEEAVASEPSDKPAGTVIKEYLRGYKLHDRLLRPAQVVVSSGQRAS